MKLGRGIVCLLAVSTVSLAAAGQGNTSDRTAAIWSYVQDRIDRQTDVWFDAGDFPAAIQMLRVSAELEPHNYETVTNLGWMLENIQEWDSAEAVYKRYQVDNPKDPDRALPIAQYYYLKRKYDKVPPLLEPTIGGKPSPHANVFRMLAGSYERLDKLADAKRVWTQYLAIAPDDGQAKANLERVESKLKGGK